MPFVVLAAIRLFRALVATARLLLDVRTLRALPWSYVRGLPLRDRYVGAATSCLGLALVALCVSPVTNRAPEVAALLALAGIVSTWYRSTRRRARRS
jgi:hypothetical protein